MHVNRVSFLYYGLHKARQYHCYVARLMERKALGPFYYSMQIETMNVVIEVGVGSDISVEFG